MHLTQFLIFEISATCNRGGEHWQCPNRAADRWANTAGRRPLSDAQIVDVAHAMYGGGFTGCLAFHHYCEPLTQWPRLKNLIAQVRVCVPQSRFLLWTNGDLLPQDLDELRVFEQCMVTNYAGRDLGPLRAVIPALHEIPTTLDWRLNPPRSAPSHAPRCIRPFLEIIFDFYGNVRTCCMDWKNETGVGNLHDTPFAELWQRWLARRAALAAEPMGTAAPLRCLTCGTRYLNLAHYVPEVAARTLEFLAAAN